MITLVALQELIPLQDPSEGWKANYGFWIRIVILAFVVGHTVMGQAKVMIDGVVISTARQILLSACAAVMFFFGAVAITALVIFPVPFCVLTMAPVFYTFLIIAVRLIVGRHVLHEMIVHSDQLIRFICFVCAQVSLACIYPSYESLFRIVQGTQYQMLVIILLPMIKVAVKNMLLRCTAHMEDMVPEAVIFTVDFFNTLYVATCMQSASSVVAVIAIMVTDLLQTCVMLYGLHRRIAMIRPKLQEITNIPSDRNCVLTMVSALCKDADKFSRQIRHGIRIRSCLLHCSAETNKIHLQFLRKNFAESHRVVESDNATGLVLDRAGSRTNTCNLRLLCTRNRRDSIMPILPSARGPTSENTITHQDSQTKRSTILIETLEVLFTTECIVVAAYLEAFVPLFYCNYMFLMVHLPSAQYHTEMAGVTHDNVGSTVRPVWIFGLLQVVSFVFLVVLIKRNLGMQALYQLGFVLETQMALVQGKLIMWMVVTFCFRVVHFGMDFTYKFDWIK
ncbi:hypothetical protein PPTG_06845 [Phytophthora nicotianae INRA-310]|uniref:Uncharacterized protein n=2 Tax=Phytophthora nicotianae TaxID=4792 RepID=W2QR68_PHYN3|nr:hypothetical protein PPTG_06845 [Phytophthora nicotianae INRA-310]ETN15608.1 hypothetical protein PPTG_06845 [Phytophthora nicotianae INRA-310]ETO84350.1 hypothetical protein F444_01732 [Phytophthora nicotianae P1976]